MPSQSNAPLFYTCVATTQLPQSLGCTSSSAATYNLTTVDNTAGHSPFSQVQACGTRSRQEEAAEVGMVRTASSAQLPTGKASPTVLLRVLRPRLQQQGLTLALLTALRNLQAAAATSQRYGVSAVKAAGGVGWADTSFCCWDDSSATLLAKVFHSTMYAANNVVLEMP